MVIDAVHSGMLKSSKTEHHNTTNKKPNCAINVELHIFVPATYHSSLQKQLQKADDQFSKVHKVNRIKFIERNGDKLIDLLGRKDPWGNSPCERDDCWTCLDEMSAGACRYEGITYTIIC